MSALLASPSALVDALSARTALDVARVEEARRAVHERALEYPLGAGQADLFAVVAGLKPLLRHTLSHEEARRAASQGAALGLATRIVREPVAHAHGREQARVYVGADRARLVAAADAEAARDDRELGRLLGYPRCCVDAFMLAPRPHTTAAVLHRNYGGYSGVGARRLNCIDLQVFHFVPWLPCSPNCGLSRRYADAVAEAIASPANRRVLATREAIDGGRFVDAIDRALAASRLHVFAGVQLSLRGAVSERGVVVDAAWPTARDRHPGSTLGEDEAGATALLLGSIRRGSHVAVVEQAIVVDGEPLCGAPHAFLTHFE